jgi:hypothetical protein
MSLVVESIIGIIGKHSKQRNEKEILPVIPWLKKRSKMLSSQNDSKCL